MMQDLSAPFSGVAGRRTFLREADGGAIIVYGITEKGVPQDRFCTRAEWDEWCELHAPPVAAPGQQYPGRTKSLAVVQLLESGQLEVLVTEKRIVTQEWADRLVRRLAAELKRDPVAPTEPDDDDGS